MCDECNDTGVIEERCTMCNGTGEGMFDGSTCNICHGKSVEYLKCDCDCYKYPFYTNKELYILSKYE